jgi:uncharacterized protein
MVYLQYNLNIIFSNMLKNKGVVSFLFVVIAFIFYYTFNSQNAVDKPPSLEYASRLNIERTGKDKYLKDGEESPIENKSDFKGLKYFDIDEKYKVIAKLTLMNSLENIILNTTGNEKDTLVKYGEISFELNGSINTLSVFNTKNNKLLFLPFRDLTNNKETYGGGRFLDIPLSNVAGNKMVIDFNLAYHPYCAYNHTYICPIPPKENTLNIEVKAGEKLL